MSIASGFSGFLYFCRFVLFFAFWGITFGRVDTNKRHTAPTTVLYAVVACGLFTNVQGNIGQHINGINGINDAVAVGIAILQLLGSGLM